MAKRVFAWSGEPTVLQIYWNIARHLEMEKVPGCRIATCVLSDGDLIQVDADKGVVRKVT